jgi:hypothetical protein
MRMIGRSLSARNYRTGAEGRTIRLAAGQAAKGARETPTTTPQRMKMQNTKAASPRLLTRLELFRLNIGGSFSGWPIASSLFRADLRGGRRFKYWRDAALR